MEIENGKNHKFIVCAYELFGTAFLVYCLNLSDGNSMAIAFTLFSLMVLCGKISGAHFNPSVTIGVYI